MLQRKMKSEVGIVSFFDLKTGDLQKVRSHNKARFFSKFGILSKLACLLIVGCFLSIGCAKQSDEITVISREEGSGTRGAFIELFGIEEKGDGFRTDRTTKEAVIAKQTDVLMVGVAGDANAIGYISLGSLNDTVKAIPIDGVTPTQENVQNGSYQVSRPFILATKSQINEIAQDFMDFILSAQGQTIVSNSYIAAASDQLMYNPSTLYGKIVVAGSSSVMPLMEKLKEAYELLNPNVTVEVQQSDSTTGLLGAIDGTCDIAMSSRDLKGEELESLTPTTIALDGIAIIVHVDNPISGLTSTQIREIYVGETLHWSELQ
ncbi:MAG: substrate-binding domain-containing protein [Clostridium sp.]|jgi:phosphate transport system substrate-binding protein|nr:substrate-binding domain-containing protein [Clostridium sp.]